MAQINPARPVVGGDSLTWGDKLNNVLQQAIDQGNATDATVAALSSTIQAAVFSLLVTTSGLSLSQDTTAGTITINLTNTTP